ncbi:hypothetical protein D9M73_186160 [compost metagenome]
MLRLPSLSSRIAAYSVVVLPDPVGPVTRMMPLGSVTASLSNWWMAGVMPSASSVIPAFSLSRMRNTTRSPARLGKVDTRTSSNLPPSVSPMRPSCGTRRSAMSSRAITLMRLTTTGATCGGMRSVSRSTPSIRIRTTSPVS